MNDLIETLDEMGKGFEGYPLGCVQAKTCKDAAQALREAEEIKHTSAPDGCKCSDCTMDDIVCPTCYFAWWQKKHPNTNLVSADDSELNRVTDRLLERDKRVGELESVLRQVRSNMNKRAVDNFDYDGGEYPINGDTINMLVLDIAERDKRVAELQEEVEKALCFGYHYRQHPQMRGSSLSACKAVYREQALKGGDDDNT